MLKLELKIGNKKMGLSENDCNYWSMWTIIAPRKVPAWHFPNLICGLSAANLLHHQTHKFLFIVLTKIAIRNYQTPSKHMNHIAYGIKCGHRIYRSLGSGFWDDISVSQESGNHLDGPCYRLNRLKLSLSADFYYPSRLWRWLCPR